MSSIHKVLLTALSLLLVLDLYCSFQAHAICLVLIN